MKHARDDYNQMIQQCDKIALRKLFDSMLATMVASGVDPAARIEFTLQFDEAMRQTIPVEEPVFLIRGQDAVGAAAVRAWAHLHRNNGGNDAMYAMAMAHADKMEQWPEHKLADLPTAPQDVPAFNPGPVHVFEGATQIVVYPEAGKE